MECNLLIPYGATFVLYRFLRIMLLNICIYAMCLHGMILMDLILKYDFDAKSKDVCD